MRFFILFFTIYLVLGCSNRPLDFNQFYQNVTPSPSPTTTSSEVNPSALVLNKIMMTKILFTSATPGGSFNTLQSISAIQSDHSQGTVPAPGYGHRAVRTFNADNSAQGVINDQGEKSNWPTWLDSFEIGISGSQNTAATNPRCATFAEITESSTTNCYLGPSTSLSPGQCGAQLGQFRVSEVDCDVEYASMPPAQKGNGGPSDGIYLRAFFERSQMNSYENILVNIDYTASSLDPAPSNPMTCWNNGVWASENCSNFTWRTYLKRSAQETVLPFLMLIPPTFASVLNPAYASGAYFGSKQFILPLATDPQLSVLQISRTQAKFSNKTNLIERCTNSQTPPGNSPLCAGVIFHAISFYRI